MRFWKSRAKDLQDTLRDTEFTLKDFEESSKELEKEMDRELNSANSRASELQLRAEKLKGEVDDWKTKYQRTLADHNTTLQGLNKELSMLRESHNIYKNKLRDMELDNDELENAERMVASSLADMEGRYNKAIERTALLEEELVEKSRLEEENQRLKDELQEVNEELSVLRDRLASGHPSTRAETPVMASNKRFSTTDVAQRPLSRLSDRPPSRTTSHFSQATKAKSVIGRTSVSAHARRDSSDIRATMNESPSMVSSPSQTALRARQSLSGRPTSSRASRANATRGSSMAKMAGLLQNLRDLQATVHTATRISQPDVSSAIPRPSSRLSSSIGPSSTPRRYVEPRHDDTASPSSIPVPSSGLSRSRSERPSSRLSMAHASADSRRDYTSIPSSIRSQTPTFEHASLDFLEQDPAKLRRRSQQTIMSSVGNTSLSASTVSRPRGSTVTSTSNPLRKSHAEEGSLSALRKSINPRTGRPAPPPSFRTMTLTRQRSGSMDSS